MVSIIPGEKGRIEVRMMEIPLVPPNKSPAGKINTSVLTAYKTLPKNINK